jgi:hypothetical protein
VHQNPKIDRRKTANGEQLQPSNNFYRYNTSTGSKAANDYSNLKYLFFGTSRTYGVLLRSRETQAFPALLGGKNSFNLAVCVGNPHHPALRCIYSMIEESGYGDQSFDVIVLGNILISSLRRLNWRNDPATSVSRMP